jgi:hypothetical protein
MSEKAARERRVFQEFLRLQGSPEAAEFESREPPEPDILWHKKDGPIAFELVEVCDPIIARVISEARNDDQTPYLRCEDPTPKIQEKLGKKYRTEYPIELLCYTSGRTVSPDPVILEQLRRVFADGVGAFRQVWLLGDKCHLVEQELGSVDA